MDELVARGVRVRIIGNRCRVDEDIRQMIEDAESAHRAATRGLNLTFAFDYGGQEEIAAAARELARAAAEGRLDPETITPELFAVAAVHQRAARTRSRDPHQRRTPLSAISCSGSRPMPN